MGKSFYAALESGKVEFFKDLSDILMHMMHV